MLSRRRWVRRDYVAPPQTLRPQRAPEAGHRRVVHNAGLPVGFEHPPRASWAAGMATGAPSETHRQRRAGDLFDDVLARPRLEGSGELVGLGSGTRAIAQARDKQEVEHWDREVERDAERSGHVGHRHR